MSTHIFYAASLNVTANQKEILFSPVGQSPIDSSANATFNIDPAIVSDMFRFDIAGTADQNVADASGVKFLVSYAKATFDPSNTDTFPYTTDYPALTKVDVGQMIPSNSNDPIGLDALYAAVKTMFGSVTAISLVNNQSTVVDSTHQNIANATSVRLKELNDLAELKDANDVEDNPSAEMFNLIWQTEPHRFYQGADATSGWKSDLRVADPGTEYKMPFIAGDKIVFQILINPATAQINDPENFLPGQENNPVVRTYNLTLNCT